MKYILTYFFGVSCGAAAMYLWLHKEIKERLEKSEKDSELPFTVGDAAAPDDSEKPLRSDSEGSEGHSDEGTGENAQKRAENRKQIRRDYHKLVEDTVNTPVQDSPFQSAPLQVPIMSRDEVPEMHYLDEKKDPEDVVTNLSEIPEGTFEIDMETYENDDDYTKEQYIYFAGSRTMSTENGTIIPNYGLFVGSDWEQYIGHYANKTAFIRNPKLSTDYEIYVEAGLYSDEFGPYDEMRED